MGASFCGAADHVGPPEHSIVVPVNEAIGAITSPEYITLAENRDFRDSQITADHQNHTFNHRLDLLFAKPRLRHSHKTLSRFPMAFIASSFISTSSFLSRSQSFRCSSRPSVRLQPTLSLSPPPTEVMPSSITRLVPGQRFSQIVIHNDTVYLAGQVARNTDGTIYGQASATLKKIDDLLLQADSHKTQILSATVYLSDIRHFVEFNRAWDDWLDKSHMPVRATVQATLAAPELDVEVTVIAARKKKTIIKTTEAASAVGPYNQGVVVEDGTVYVSGCIGLEKGDGGAMVAGGVEKEAERALENLKAILGEVGLGMEDVVKTTVLLDNMADFAKVNAVYSQFFTGEGVPARSCFAAKELPKGALVEIDAVAKLR